MDLGDGLQIMECFLIDDVPGVGNKQVSMHFAHRENYHETVSLAYQDKAVILGHGNGALFLIHRYSSSRVRAGRTHGIQGRRNNNDPFCTSDIRCRFDGPYLEERMSGFAWRIVTDVVNLIMPRLGMK